MPRSIHTSSDLPARPSSRASSTGGSRTEDMGGLESRAAAATLGVAWAVPALLLIAGIMLFA